MIIDHGWPGFSQLTGLRTIAQAITCKTVLLLLFHLSPITTAGQDISGPADRLFNPHKILSLSITIATNELESLWKAPRTYVRAQVREGTNVWNEIGIHLKGGMGSGQPLTQKPSLSLNFSKFRKTSRFYGLKRIQLNNCVQDPTYLSEVVASQLFTDAGVPCARCTHARIQLNERDLGIYVLREAVDELFLHKHFKGLSGRLYQGSYGADLLDQLTPTSDGLATTIPFNGIRTAFALRNNNDRLREIGRWVDLEAFYRFMAVENIIDHFDGYSRSVNNYRIFVPSHTNIDDLLSTHRIVFIPNGLDQAFTCSKGPVIGLVAGKVSEIILDSPPAQKQYFETYRRVFQNSAGHYDLTSKIGALQVNLTAMLSSIDTNLANQQDRHARQLRERIHSRLLHLSNYFRMEAIGSILSESQGRLPDSWIAHEVRHESQLYRTNTVNGNAVLVVETRSTTHLGGGTWRMRMKLEPGVYRLAATFRLLYSSQWARAVPTRIILQFENGRRMASESLSSAGIAKRITSDSFMIDHENSEVEISAGMNGLYSAIGIDSDSITVEKVE